jgi:sugar phosphate isomerase/epimerase
MFPETISRRSFLILAGATPFAMASSRSTTSLKRKNVPIGLELYSVRDELKQDLTGTVRAVAEMGYEGVEFYAPYFEWTPTYAKDVRKLLDELNIRCFSTHNARQSFTAENLPHAIELNQIIGSRFIVMAHPGKVENLEGWKVVADALNNAADKLRPLGLRAGFHNHGTEWKPVDGTRPIDVIASNTAKDVALQLDTATCLSAGADPVAFIKANPGRVVSYHCKDWSSDPEKGYRVLLGEGIASWKEIIETAEMVGGVEYYLIEQEGSRYSPLETAKRCLENFRKLRDSLTQT